MRKVTVHLKVTLDIHMNGEDVQEVLENMDYNFTSQTDTADIMDTEITDWEVVDSR